MHGVTVELRSSSNNTVLLLTKTRSSAVAKRPRNASCLYSFNTKRRAQSFVISCFGFRYTTYCVQLNSFLCSSMLQIYYLLRTIKFFSVLFYSPYLSMLSQTNIRWCVANCAVYTAWSSVTVFVTS